MIDKSKMLEALDLVAKGIVQPTKIAKALGMTYTNFRRWLVRSNSGDPDFLIEVDGETGQFAMFVALHTRLAILELKGKVIQESIYGWSEPVRGIGGAVVWEVDNVAAAMTVEERVALGFHPEALKIGPDNGLVRAVENHHSPIALSIRVLEAYASEFTPKSISQVNVAGGMTVRGVGIMPRPDRSRGPGAIPPKPEIPQLEILRDVVPLSDPELDELLGPEPVPVSISIPAVTVFDTDPAAPIEVAPDPELKPLQAPVKVKPPEGPTIRTLPDARTTPIPQPENSVLGKAPPPTSSWRADWDRLSAKQSGEVGGRPALPSRIDTSTDVNLRGPQR
jgi:hypothetical protein